VRLLSLCGTADPFLALAREGVAVLRGLGLAVEASETAGGHDWATWRAHLAQVLPRLFR
jgi:enterochelin esterase-like enzyme